jgi:hypothetical protein
MNGYPSCSALYPVFCYCLQDFWHYETQTGNPDCNACFLTSIAVGLLGAYFHLVRAILPNAPLEDIVSVALLVWAPPVLGPLTFALVGLMGISAAWIEDPPDSGILTLLGGMKVHLPYSKRALVFHDCYGQPGDGDQ